MGQEAVAASNRSAGARKPHAVVMPLPLQGHVNPATHLALRLAERGFTVTFVYTESVHHKITSGAGNTGDVFAAARASSSSSLDVRYEVVSDGLPLGFDRSLHEEQFMEAQLHLLPAHVEELLRRIVTDPSTTCLIADTFFVWPATLARKLGVPYVSFWTQPALVFNLYYHMDLLTKNGHFKCQEPRKDAITYIPGVPSIEPCDLISYLQETDTTTPIHRIIEKAFLQQARGADVLVCNTVEELEPSTIAALRADRPVYAVGPVLPAGFARSAVATSMWAESDCSRWLDAQPMGSVLYISFGSYAHVTRDELHAIARGVLDSGARFLWVLRPDVVSSDDPDPLPEGFAAAMAGRGLVVPWCSQVEVLAHAAVGGFLTHCGWNSILESAWAGVPMLCFPVLTDQLTNRSLVVKEWRAGASIGDRGTLRADEVRARIQGLMTAGAKLKEQVRKLRDTLHAAVAPGGSSRRNFDELVDDLQRRCASHVPMMS